MSEHSTISDNEESASYRAGWRRVRTSEERLARLEADLAHLARMMLLTEIRHYGAADLGQLREIAKRVEGAEDE